MNHNMLFVSRPTKADYANAQCNNCNSLGPCDPTYVRLLGPRKEREVVREQIKHYVLGMLGAPSIKLELDEQQLDLAVDEALMIFEDYAPMEYFQYHTFNTVPGQSVYEMPPDVGLIRKVSYLSTPVYAFSASDLGGVIPLEYMGAGAYGSIAGGINPQQPVWGKMSEWVLYKQYEAMFQRISSQQGGWEWLGGYNHVKLYPVPFRTYTVVVHYLQKKANFREVKQAMQEGALAFARIMLGEIRSRIQNPPGPNGGVQLNGQDILQRGTKEKEEWEERLITRFGDVLGPTWG
jgi:hypothetical protein